MLPPLRELEAQLKSATCSAEGRQFAESLSQQSKLIGAQARRRKAIFLIATGLQLLLIMPCVVEANSKLVFVAALPVVILMLTFGVRLAKYEGLVAQSNAIEQVWQKYVELLDRGDIVLPNDSVEQAAGDQ